MQISYLRTQRVQIEGKPTSFGGERLRDNHLLRDLDMAALDRIAGECLWRDYAPNQSIISHLDDSSDCFFIVAGEVRVVVYSLSGREVVFRDIPAGEVVGELAAIDGRPRTASVIALTPVTVARISADSFWRILQEHPSAAAVMIRRLADLSRTLTDRIIELSTMAIAARVRVELLRLAGPASDTQSPVVIDPAPTHAMIASLIGTRREAVSRELGVLAELGLVRQDGRRLILLDPSGLRASVEEIDSLSAL